MIKVFSVITGDKDKIENWPENVTLFYNDYDLFKDDRRNSRIQKIMPHLYMTCEYSLYIDGNIRLLKTPEELIETYLKEYDIALFKHPTRDCLYNEALVCAKMGLDDPETIIEQVKDYELTGYGKHKGLCECGIILRRHTPQVQALNERWWAHYCRYSRRDQISFMKAVDEVGIPIKIISEPFLLRPDGSAERTDGSFEIYSHNHRQ